MRWEIEGGAAAAANDGNHRSDRARPKRSSRRGHDRRDRRVSVQTGRYPDERRWPRGVMAP